MNITAQTPKINGIKPSNVVPSIWDNAPACAIILDGVKLPGLARIAYDLAAEPQFSDAICFQYSDARCAPNLRKRRILFRAQNGSEHAIEVRGGDERPINAFCEPLGERLRVRGGCTIVEDAWETDDTPAKPIASLEGNGAVRAQDAEHEEPAALTSFELWAYNGFGPLLQPGGHPAWTIHPKSKLTQGDLAKTPAGLDADGLAWGRGDWTNQPPARRRDIRDPFGPAR